jgi:hypothetical protein
MHCAATLTAFYFIMTTYLPFIYPVISSAFQCKKAALDLWEMVLIKVSATAILLE